MSYQVHNFQTGEIIEAAPINEMDEQIRKNSEEKIDVSKIGVANGVAGLDNSGKVPLSQLPNSESDIIEGYYYNNKFYEDSSHTTEIAAERRKIYIDLPTNETYRWDGETYVVTSSDTSGKADKVQNATEGNFAGLDANGNLTDSGKKPSDFLTQHQDISGKLDKDQGSANAGKFMKVGNDGNLVPDTVPDPTGKADKVSGATNGNFAGLDANGNLTDSGKKPSDFLTQHQDISGKVDKNQGTENAGKALGINDQGQVVPVPFSGEDFRGATATSAGTHGYVPAPAAGDQKKVLMGDGTWDNAPGAKIYTRTITITNTSGTYSQTFTDENISQDMKAVTLEVLNPDVYGDRIRVQCLDGSFVVSCPSVTGSDTAKISFMKVCEDPTAITSTEFTILNNRLMQVENVEVNYDVIIPVNAWTLDSGEYVYTWSNSTLNENTSVSIEFLNDDTDIDYIEAEKITGGVKFYSKWLPDNTIHVNVRVCYARDYQIVDISGDTVSTDVVSGASNVNEALDILQDNISDAQSDITSVSTQVANTNAGLSYVESGDTIAANPDYTAGKFIMWKDVIYRIKATIDATVTSENWTTYLTKMDGTGGALTAINNDITSLNSNISDLDNRKGYFTLAQAQQITNAYVTRSTYNNRKFSDYDLIAVTPLVNGWLKGTSIVTKNAFLQETGMEIHTYVGSNPLEVDVKYVSDTSYDAKFIGSPGQSVYVFIYGIFAH